VAAAEAGRKVRATLPVAMSVANAATWALPENCIDRAVISPGLLVDSAPSPFTSAAVLKLPVMLAPPANPVWLNT
jgi:hypothetical protein